MKTLDQQKMQTVSGGIYGWLIDGLALMIFIKQKNFRRLRYKEHLANHPA